MYGIIYENALLPALLLLLPIAGAYLGARLLLSRLSSHHRRRTGADASFPMVTDDRKPIGGNNEKTTGIRTGAVSPLTATLLALGGTLGVGNIIGVVLALTVGGPGALFWMMISVLFSAPVKYAEVALALSFRRVVGGVRTGGAMYYMEGKKGKKSPLSVLFAVLCLLASLSLGPLIQGNAVSDALRLENRTLLICLSVMLSLCLFLSIRRGGQKLSRLVSVIIPVASVLYIVLCAGVLFHYRARIPDALHSVMVTALTPLSVGGGVLGYTVSSGIRQGFSRGLLSNEAGCGTAPIAHALSSSDDPVRQGAFGVFEVVFDTWVLCSLTGLSFLVCSPDLSLDEAPFTQLCKGFSSVWGNIAPYLLSLCILCFAYATMLCWSHYGSEALRYLTQRERSRLVYHALYAAATVIGMTVSLQTAYALTDILLAVMTILNLFTILLRTNDIPGIAKSSKCK